MSDDNLPFVTFWVKAYRQERIVAEAIESAFAQTYPNLEIILSDDASPDGTFDVMQEMAAAYAGPHRVRLNRNPENLGIRGHASRLWELAEGRLVTGCAGDDMAEPEKVERLVAAWSASGGRVALVHSRATTIDAAGREIGEARPDPRIVADPSPLNVVRTLANHIGATALYDRRMYEVFGPLPEAALIEDGPQFFRAALLGDIAYVDAPLVRYRVGGVSNPELGSPGHFYLRGHRMTGLVWWQGNFRAFLEDMAKVGHPDATEIERLCRGFLARAEPEIAAWRAGGPLGRLALLPRAATQSIQLGDTTPLFQTAKHLLGSLYIRYLDRRTAGTRLRDPWHGYHNVF